ncbi:hypothetical protein OIU74_014387 [Salix koriyanagi]|uniref:Uncharacterized protein n=1 Tax=Salix koriyanagi TaxID=2511006 RepID=A0A9Q0PVM9_9ROSI|nr:hypothetical protein OIU74_014387 [Salix koriyanagi]
MEADSLVTANATKLCVRNQNTVQDSFHGALTRVEMLSMSFHPSSLRLGRKISYIYMGLIIAVHHHPHKLRL